MYSLDAWQRINLSKAKPETRKRILAGRQTSLEYVKAFGRLGRAVIARGGSASFEWPRHCEGWKEVVVQAILRSSSSNGSMLTSAPSECSLRKTGEPILKPWRIAVSSPLMRQALDGLRCQGGATSTPRAPETKQPGPRFTRHTCATRSMTDWTRTSPHPLASAPATDALRLFRVRNQNPLTFGSATVKVSEPEAGNRNPLTLSFGCGHGLQT